MTAVGQTGKVAECLIGLFAAESGDRITAAGWAADAVAEWAEGGYRPSGYPQRVTMILQRNVADSAQAAVLITVLGNAA